MTITSKTPRDRPIPDDLCEVCRKACGYGIGFDEHAKWYCREHVPADFFAENRKKVGGGEMTILKPETITAQGILGGGAVSHNQQIDLFGTL